MNRNIADFGFQTADYRKQGRAACSVLSQFAIRNPRSGGFTLLEVLLALAILAVVMTVIYASVSAAGSSVEHAEAVRDRTDLARTLLARMTTDLTNAYCRPGTKDHFFQGKKEEREIEGKKVRIDSIALTTLTNWRRPDSKESDLWAVGYSFKERPEGGSFVLMRSEKRITNDEAVPAEAAEYEITDTVAGLRLRYWDGSRFSDEKDQGGTSVCARPAAVEISLTMNDGTVFMTELLMPKVSL